MSLPRVSTNLPPHLHPANSALAFEERMLPKLNREIGGEDVNDRKRALNSLKVIALNQEQAYQMRQLGLLETLGAVLCDPDDFCREYATEIFCTLCAHNMGRQATIKFIPNLSALFRDSNVQTRVNVHKTLNYLTDVVLGISAIIGQNLIPVLIKLLQTEKETQVLRWIIQTLNKCLMMCADEALEHSGLKTLKKLLELDDSVILEFSLRAIAEITVPLKGKNSANKTDDLTDILVKFLSSDEPEQQAAAACAIGSMSITTEGKTKSFDSGCIEPLCKMLDSSLSEARLMALSALEICGEVPAARMVLREHLDTISELVSDDEPLVRDAAQKCIEIIKWRP